MIITTEDAIPETDEDSDYLHVFEVYDKKHKVLLSKKWEIRLFELSKLPVTSDGTIEWTWGSLLVAEEEAQFNMLATTYPEVAEAVKAIKELSADPVFRYEAFLIEKAKRDWLLSMESSKDEGFDEGIGVGEQRGRLNAAIDAIKNGVFQPAVVAAIGDIDFDRAEELIAQYASK
ncbi:hypothetical protein AGMMS49992_13000 [Clostridia bacterium]|nr:hypothetical protein AGMMS49992_13000 [Clostridia bacterium]